jgi:hypothetical protein
VSDMSLANDGGRSDKGSAEWRAGPPSGGPSHSYPLLVRDHGLGTALKLLLETLPYALARWSVLLGFATACALWALVAVGGAVWLGTHVATVFGYCWLLRRPARRRMDLGHDPALYAAHDRLWPRRRADRADHARQHRQWQRRPVRLWPSHRHGPVRRGRDPVRARRANPGRAARVSQCARYAWRLAAGPPA